ncbi:MAG: chemotaxis response regulator protein-glutamate methylesterase [Verrucomicrobiota bacterium]|nr:chemotaxis response regulator protein-glutamate methylesterase [Limisphaera sp.]MDW8380894.1 chemotaxis response regulator protein-glutamate methylesterase [Verrucomicrobiota bacterium]
MKPIPKPIRVLIVDDSAVVRKALADALAQDPEIEVVGTASDPYVAREKILELRPDVLTLDLEMPRMDGLTFLRILRQHYPLPVVVVSSLTPSGSQAALAALEAGAVDVLGKPTSAWSIGNLTPQLIPRIKAAATARMPTHRKGPQAQGGQPLLKSANFSRHPWQVILIGASTGGTEAIREVLTCLPSGLPPILIVQHIPPVFSKAFADRLGQSCTFQVREASHGEPLQPNLALIAPGDYHMRLVWAGGQLRVHLSQDPPLHHTRPAVDHLFQSAATTVGRYAVAVLLTGMGNDGAEGMRAIKRAGGYNIAQDEQTCVVFGMPRAAIAAGVVDQILPLHQIPEGIMRALSQNRSIAPNSGSLPAASMGSSKTNANP